MVPSSKVPSRRRQEDLFLHWETVVPDAHIVTLMSAIAMDHQVILTFQARLVPPPPREYLYRQVISPSGLLAPPYLILLPRCLGALCLTPGRMCNL